MNKGKEVISSFYNAISKMIWLNSIRMKEELSGLNPSEIHCIEYIHENSQVNVKRIADAFLMTTGGITKLTKKLVEKGYIENYQLNGNKKEVYFKLTKQGDEIFEKHKQLHSEFDQRDQVIFDTLTDEECEKMIQYAKLFEEHLQKEIEKRDAGEKQQDKF